MAIERVNLSDAPLLANPVIERDYTRDVTDIEDINYSEVKTTTNEEEAETINEEEVKENIGHKADTPPPPPQPPDDVPTMSFEEEKEEELSEDEDDSEEEIDVDTDNIISANSEIFSEIATELYSNYTPPLFHQFCKVDIKDINEKMPQYVEYFSKLNEQTLQALEMSNQNKNLLKKALSEYLKLKQPKFATPENALLAVIIADGVARTMVASKLGKQVKQSINELIINTDYNFKKEQEKEQEKASKVQEKETSEEEINKKNKIKVTAKTSKKM